MQSTNEKLSFREKFCYGLGDASANIFMGFTMMFLTVYYTDVFKLNPAVMGTLFLISRFLDAVFDPLIGMISDRTQSKYGKYRSWLLYFSIPYGLSCGVLFLGPDLGEMGRAIYAYISYIVLILCYSCMLVPYVSLLGALTPNSNERLSVNAIRFPLDKVAWFACSAIVPGLLALFDNALVGYRVVMGGIGIFCIILVLLCFFNTKERVNIPVDTTVSFDKQILLLIKNEQADSLFIGQIMIMAANTLKFGAAAYFVKYIIESESAFVLGCVLSAGSIAGMISPFICNIMLQRSMISRNRMLTISQILAAITIASIGLCNLNNTVLVIACVFISSIFCEMVSILIWASVQDCANYSLLKHKINITGVVSGGMLFSTKLGMAIGGALLGYVLAFYDYDPDATTLSHEQLACFVMLFCYLPAICHVLAAISFKFYKLEASVCDRIQKEIDTQNLAKFN